MTNITSTGIFTAPESGLYIVEAYGGGGGGASNVGGGGGSGVYASKRVVLTVGQQIQVIIGQGGPAGNGGDGDPTSFGSMVVADGGKGGNGSAGGLGGLVANSVGDTILAGRTGSPGTGVNGGAGANAPGPIGGDGGPPSPAGGIGGEIPGAGGSGGRAFAGSNQGGSGGRGLVQVDRTDFVPTYGENLEEYEAPGQFIWTAPAEGEVVMQAVGAGAGAGGGTGLISGAGGAGGGAYSSSVITVSRGDQFMITVGTAGLEGAYGGSAGTDGTASTVSLGGVPVLVADGGKGSPGGSGGTGGDPGLGGQAANSVGDTVVAGLNGLPAPTGTFDGGAGGAGAPPLGGAGGAANGQQEGLPGTAPGGGGSGGGTITGSHGGAGSAGLVQIGFFLTRGSEIIDGEEKFVTTCSLIEGGVRKQFTAMSIIKNGTRHYIERCRQNLEITLPPYPVWLPSGQEALFNRQTGTFNWGAGSTKTSAAIAAGDFNFVGVGDSVMEGFTYLNNQIPFNFTVDRLHAFPALARNKIVASTGASQDGTGLVRTVGAVGDSDLRWSFAANVGKNGHYVTLNSGTEWAQLNSDRFGDTAAAILLDSAGTFAVSVDGATSGAGFTIYTGTGSNQSVRVTLSGLPQGQHSVRISRISGTCLVVGADVYQSAPGIRMHNLGQGGATASETGQPSWSDTSGGTLGNMLPVYSNQVACFGGNADAVLIMLGGNDMAGPGPRDYDTISDAFTAIGEAFETVDTDIIFITEPHGSTEFATPAGYSNPLYERLYATALTKGWGVIDAEWLTGGYEYLASQGYTGDIYGHLNNAGASYVGGFVAGALTSGVI